MQADWERIGQTRWGRAVKREKGWKEAKQAGRRGRFTRCEIQSEMEMAWNEQ